jgi:hypothetical protein
MTIEYYVFNFNTEIYIFKNSFDKKSILEIYNTLNIYINSNFQNINNSELRKHNIHKFCDITKFISWLIESKNDLTLIFKHYKNSLFLVTELERIKEKLVFDKKSGLTWKWNNIFVTYISNHNFTSNIDEFNELTPHNNFIAGFEYYRKVVVDNLKNDPLYFNSLNQMAYSIWKKQNNYYFPKLNNYNIYFLNQTNYESRREVYRMKVDKKPLYYSDFNSFYPYIMMNYKLPVGKPNIYLDLKTNIKHIQKIYKKNDSKLVSIKDLDYLIKKLNNCDINNIPSELLGFMKVKVINPALLYIPVLPSKARLNKKKITRWDNYNMVSTWYVPELKLAIDRGYKVEKIYEFHQYQHSDKIFVDYINKLKQIKLNNNNCLKKFAKSMMNILFGKFLQKYKGVYINYPPIGIAVISYGRIILYNILNKYNKNIIMCNTDAIITTKKIDEYSDNEFGKMKLLFESKEASGIFLNPNAWVIKNKNGKIIKRKTGMKKATWKEYSTYLTLKKNVYKKRIIKNNITYPIGYPFGTPFVPE